MNLASSEIVFPEKFKGAFKANGGFTSTTPREWTEEEIKFCACLKEQGYSYKQIAEIVDRTATSVSIKMKRISKQENKYNVKHVEDKYQVNRKFLDAVNPDTVLDVFCGEKNFYSEYQVTTNDKNSEIDADYHMDALRLLCKLYSEGKKFDVIDLDPYGSAYDCFDLAVKMARKGLVITLGEVGHKRWKRLDFVGDRYGIRKIEDFTIQKLIERIQQIGKQNKKKLSVFDFREWSNIGRVWFLIDSYRETSQWEKVPEETSENMPLSHVCENQLDMFYDLQE